MNLVDHPINLGDEDDLKSVRGHGSIAQRRPVCRTCHLPAAGIELAVTSTGETAESCTLMVPIH